MKLLNQIQKEATKFNIIVEEIDGGVELRAPEGYQFEEELHGIVTTQWDHEPMPNVFRRALQDIQTFGPRLKKCPADCPCMD